jgi:hypothetical protein
MWLFTTIGFYSVVAHEDDPRTMLIRARVREDLDNLRRHHLPDLEIVEGAGTDYRYRAFVSRDEWEHAAAGLAAAVDYPNFKNAVAETQGTRRAHAYADVWSVMRSLQSS